MSDSPASTPDFACDLTVLDNPEAHKSSTLQLFEEVEAIEERDGDFAFRFAPSEGIVRRLGRFIEGERQCCPFFQFQLEVNPRRDPVWLYWGGGEQQKAFLRSELEDRAMIS